MRPPPVGGGAYAGEANGAQEGAAMRRHLDSGREWPYGVDGGQLRGCGGGNQCSRSEGCEFFVRYIDICSGTRAKG
jgi:hypothetical protein